MQFEAAIKLEIGDRSTGKRCNKDKIQDGGDAILDFGFGAIIREPFELWSLNTSPFYVHFRSTVVNLVLPNTVMGAVSACVV